MCQNTNYLACNFIVLPCSVRHCLWWNLMLNRWKAVSFVELEQCVIFSFMCSVWMPVLTVHWCMKYWQTKPCGLYVAEQQVSWICLKLYIHMQTLSYTVPVSKFYSGVAVLSFNLGHDSWHFHFPPPSGLCLDTHHDYLLILSSSPFQTFCQFSKLTDSSWKWSQPSNQLPHYRLLYPRWPHCTNISVNKEVRKCLESITLLTHLLCYCSCSSKLQ